jgi:hypothetical protein
MAPITPPRLPAFTSKASLEALEELCVLSDRHFRQLTTMANEEFAAKI